jgi:septum formation protein
VEIETMLKTENLNLPKLVLASASPRRADILDLVGWQFEKITADIDESVLKNENPADYVQRLAKTKAEAVAARIENEIVLGADTTVVLDNEIIGKPIDLNDARNMLEKLSGRWHEVLTGVALVNKTTNDRVTKVAFERTRVKFAALSKTEIEYLIEFGAPLDKAGAYAVQGGAALFIERIEGDYWNVVGLPVQLVYRLFSINFLKNI